MLPCQTSVSVVVRPVLAKQLGRDTRGHFTAWGDVVKRPATSVLRSARAATSITDPATSVIVRHSYDERRGHVCYARSMGILSTPIEVGDLNSTHYEAFEALVGTPRSSPPFQHRPCDASASTVTSERRSFYRTTRRPNAMLARLSCEWRRLPQSSSQKTSNLDSAGWLYQNYCWNPISKTSD